MARKQRYRAFGVDLTDGPMAGKPAVWSRHAEISGGEAVGGRFTVPGHADTGDRVRVYEYEFTAARTARFVRELGTRRPLGNTHMAAGSP
jgi:hypothetical protein